jgi:4a-hydroxytetrahydrobiopterin dehydratase
LTEEEATMPEPYGDQDLLTDAQAVEAMPKWQLVQGRMHLRAKFIDFRTAAGFVARLAEMAEDANQHPEIDIRWNRVHLAMKSRDPDGITGREVKLGQAIVPLVKALGGEIDEAPVPAVTTAVGDPQPQE